MQPRRTSQKSPMDQFLSLRSGLSIEGLPTQEQIDRVLDMLTEHPETGDDSGSEPSGLDDFPDLSDFPSLSDLSDLPDLPGLDVLNHSKDYLSRPVTDDEPEPARRAPSPGPVRKFSSEDRTLQSPVSHFHAHFLDDEPLIDTHLPKMPDLPELPDLPDLSDLLGPFEPLKPREPLEPLDSVEPEEPGEQFDLDEQYDDAPEPEESFDAVERESEEPYDSEELEPDDSFEPLEPLEEPVEPQKPVQPPRPHLEPARVPTQAPAPHVPPPLPPITQPTFTISAELPTDRVESSPVESSAPDDSLPEDRYSDRELSWLAFNNRVLDLAKDRIRVPLLERARFLAIFSSNLDEFFMVRVAGLKRRIDAGLAQRGTSGLLPRELHEAILSTSRDLVAEQARVFTDEVLPELADKGIVILRWSDLTQAETGRLSEMFKERIYPILTPLAVDPSHPFPYISGLSLNLAVQLRNPETGTRLFARIKVPNVFPRFLQVTEGRFVPLEDVISHHLDTIFTGMEILKHTTFRVTRNEDVEVEEDDAENILFALEKELLARKVGRPPVRLEVQEDIDSDLLDTLASELDVTTQEIFFVRGPLDLTGLNSIADMDRDDLKYPAFLPKTNPHLAEVETSQPADMFAAIKKRDVLLHHPYDSFATSVQRFIEQAAADPQVLAIKQTLYRTSGDSPIVDALIEAARAGKQVLALVEIKARFDEQANIAWARKLEQSGVHVVYGLVGLKTHCKLSLVIRDEGETLRRYCHIGTGNYNPKTARMYEDMGLLTSNPIITDDVARLFNHLSGMTAESHYRRLLVSPFGIRNGLLQMINHEIELQQSGTPGRIRIKVNSIVDEATMDALYRASQAGVKVDLWVRGICAMRGEVPGLSDNIRIRSILGRFLEHSRLFWFDNGGSPQVGIGSADLMHRNLDRRVEALVQLTNKEHIEEIDSLFTLAFAETTASWWLTADGWVPKTLDANGHPLVDIQEYLIQATSARRSIV